ncbi:alpha/beta hydrolase fold domain-containing protein [Streptomyces sp. NPDC058757]|uniref:alpha/beta hydrolase fold domain-containing protein n=1 Tax=Streptomyces sp. NPDC058757 TaxID=3346626 RepID=UPI0036CD7E34
MCDASKPHVLPDGVDLRMGALVEPVAVGRHAVARSGVAPGGSALIAGAGPLGIGARSAFRARGVERVLVSQPSADRRALMAALGARVVDPVGEDLAAAVAELTGGDGVDAVLVTVDYRLAPEHPDPYPAEDCCAGLLWTAAHARELGGDPDRLLVAGRGAGSGLAAGTALSARCGTSPRPCSSVSPAHPSRHGPGRHGRARRCPIDGCRRPPDASPRHRRTGPPEAMSLLT